MSLLLLFRPRGDRKRAGGGESSGVEGIEGNLAKKLEETNQEPKFFIQRRNGLKIAGSERTVAKLPPITNLLTPSITAIKLAPRSLKVELCRYYQIEPTATMTFLTTSQIAGFIDLDPEYEEQLLSAIINSL